MRGGTRPRGEVVSEGGTVGRREERWDGVRNGGEEGAGRQTGATEGGSVGGGREGGRVGGRCVCVY